MKNKQLQKTSKCSGLRICHLLNVLELFVCFHGASAPRQEPITPHQEARVPRLGHKFTNAPHKDQTGREGLECKCLISLGLGSLPSSEWVPSDFFQAPGQDLFLCQILKEFIQFPQTLWYCENLRFIGADSKRSMSRRVARKRKTKCQKHT